MVNSNTPTYYSTLHDSTTSLCKTILAFSFKKRCLLAAEHRLSKLQSDNLKWQQDSFHQMLKLMGLHKEEILAEMEVSAFRTHLLENLILPDEDHPVILRDKLLFLQELLYAKCISEEEYHYSKRPLLQRLAVQGAEIVARDVIVAGSKDPKQNSEGWAVIDLKNEQCLLNKENLNSKNKSKQAMKKIKGAPSVFSFISSYKPGKNWMEKSIIDSPSLHLDSTQTKISSSFSTKNELGHLDSTQSKISSSFSTKKELGHSQENPFWNGHTKGKDSEGKPILMMESGAPDKLKRKPFRTLFHREQREGHCGGVGGDHHGPKPEERVGRSAKRQWRFHGFKKWKKSDSDDETVPLPLNERSDSEAFLASYHHFTKAFEEGPDTKLIKAKLHSDGSPSDFFVDKEGSDGSAVDNI